ncbi:hypothetical protein LCGC14_0985200 [marine sediment metagenome]|uniref:Uncharacterized protein n=1 Tax=marine sediment metagenome TaxID=412755 RepID=A0A0F9NC01_9ZZZZ
MSDQDLKQITGKCAVCSHPMDDHQMTSTTACLRKAGREGEEKDCECGRYKVE